MKSLRPLLTLAATASLLGCLSGTNTLTISPSQELQENWDLLKHVYLHVDELDSVGAYVGKGASSYGDYADVVYMFAQLSDRFTRYIVPSQAEATLAMYLGSNDNSIGIGIYMETSNDGSTTDRDTLRIVHLIPDAPAALAGIQRGDLLVAVNGNDVTGKLTTKYSDYTMGDVGTAFTLSIIRGTDSLTFAVAKANLTIPTVWLDSVNNIPVIQVDFFAAANDSGTGGTKDEFVAALARAGDFTTAIIDLRGNPGGSVDQCLGMTDALLDTGVIVYQIEHIWADDGTTKIDTTDAWPVTANSPYEGRKYVFLEDGGSASCSEIMLAGIQRNTNWPLVGTTSYGKGIAQNLWMTNAGGLAVVTTTEFRDGNWNNYHLKGIVPNYPVSDPDSALALAVRLASGDTTTVALAKKSILDVAALSRINARLATRPEHPVAAVRYLGRR